MSKNNGQDVTKEVEIDLDKRYTFPPQISIHEHQGAYLVIYTEGVLWIVLENESQLSVFKMLQDGASISEALDRYDEDDVSNVLMQVEAKRFYAPIVREYSEKNMYVFLTNRCNQRCRHCYMYAGDRDFSELSVNQWLDVLDSFKFHGGNGVTFTGGEVTVYAGYDQIIRHAHNVGLSVTVLSNGLLWTQDDIDNLCDCIDEIQISIDGYDSSSYYSVRHSNGFSKALNCIRSFYRAGTKVSMAVTPLYEDLDDFVAGFETFAKDFLRECPEVFIRLNLELLQGREVHITPEENKEYRKKIRLLVERLYPEYYAETFALNYDGHTLRRNCGFGEISIAPNGDIFWCNRIPDLKSVVNVTEVDFGTIVSRSERIKKATSVDNTHVCKNCDIRYICGGGCRLEYDGIIDAESHVGEWVFQCNGKDNIYNKMVLSNEYFFE